MKDLHKRSQKISKDYKRTHAIQYLPNFSSIESSPLGSSMCPMVPVLRLIMFWNGLHLVLQGCLLPALREDVVPILLWPLFPMTDFHKRYHKISKDYKKNPCHPIPSKLLLYRIKPPGFKYVSHGTSPQADHVLERSSSCPPRLSPSSAERRCCPYPSLAFASHDRFSQKISKDYKRTHAIQYLPNFSSIESSPLGSSMCPMVPVLRLIFCWIGALLLQG